MTFAEAFRNTRSEIIRGAKRDELTAINAAPAEAIHDLNRYRADNLKPCEHLNHAKTENANRMMSAERTADPIRHRVHVEKCQFPDFSPLRRKPPRTHSDSWEEKL